MAIYDKIAECMSRDEIREIQTARLKAQVERCYKNVAVFRERMGKKGLLPGDIKSLDDLKFLPFTTKQDLRDYYPFDLFAAPLSDIVRIHASSGTTGRQIVAGYTRNDLEMWSRCARRRGKGRRYGNPDFLWQHRASDSFYGRARHNASVLHAVLCDVPCRVHSRNGYAG